MSAGPVDPGKIPNMFQSIICDVHDRTAEKSALGLFYTAISRATTLGDFEGRGSAIYFRGSHYNEHRFCNLAKTKNNRDYNSAAKRRQWVHYLKSNKWNPNRPDTEIQEILDWSGSFRMSIDDLYNKIQSYICNKRKSESWPSRKRRKVSHPAV
jgi:hypothetical protein